MNFEETSSSSNPEQTRPTSTKLKTPNRQSKYKQQLDEIYLNQSNSGYLEGVLQKHTNVMKGYQNRYFIVNEQKGQLEYYMLDEIFHDKRKSNFISCRGCLDLTDVIISPSEDDSQTFTVSTPDGETIYKLKASNTKERQKWVDKLRQVSLNLENSESKINHLNDVRESLLNTQKTQIKLVNAIESFPYLDRDLLMLKSTSYSSIMSLENSFAVLQGLNDLK